MQSRPHNWWWITVLPTILTSFSDVSNTELTRSSFFEHRTNLNFSIYWSNTLFLASNDWTSNFEPNRTFTRFTKLLNEQTQTSVFRTSNDVFVFWYSNLYTLFLASNFGQTVVWPITTILCSKRKLTFYYGKAPLTTTLRDSIGEPPESLDLEILSKWQTFFHVETQNSWLYWYIGEALLPPFNLKSNRLNSKVEVHKKKNL